MNPSITIRGPVSASNELTPRTRITEFDPGCPDCSTIETPARRPCNAVDKSDTGICFNDSVAFTDETAPVRSDFRITP